MTILPPFDLRPAISGTVTGRGRLDLGDFSTEFSTTLETYNPNPFRRPTLEVRLALRADNWLHHHGEVGSAKAEAIKQQIRAAFYPDKDDWKDMVWDRAVETLRFALKGLSGS